MVETNVLDMTVWDDLLFKEVRGVHHLVKAVEEMTKVFKGSPIPKTKVVDVRTESRDKSLARIEAEQEAWNRRAAETEERRRLATTHEGNAP